MNKMSRARRSCKPAATIAKSERRLKTARSRMKLPQIEEQKTKTIQDQMMRTKVEKGRVKHLLELNVRERK